MKKTLKIFILTIFITCSEYLYTILSNDIMDNRTLIFFLVVNAIGAFQVLTSYEDLEKRNNRFFGGAEPKLTTLFYYKATGLLMFLAGIYSLVFI